jgi:hypothetical protein
MNFEIHTFVLFWLSNKTVKRLLSGFAGIIGLIQTLHRSGSTRDGFCLNQFSAHSS